MNQLLFPSEKPIVHLLIGLVITVQNYKFFDPLCLQKAHQAIN
jgi:hypothetical protein